MKPINYLKISIACLVLFSFISCSKSGDMQEVKVVKGTFSIKVHAIGRLKSASSKFINCPGIYRVWEYTISSMAPEGKSVKKGDLILSFDAKEIRERFMIKKSELETAQKELERVRLVEQEALDNMVLQLAETSVNKEKANTKAQQPKEFTAFNEVKKLKMDLELAEMKEKLFFSRVDNQKSNKQTGINAIKNKITLLKNEVKRLQEALQKLRIKAPKEGIVVYSTDWRGRKRAVGDSCWRGSSVMELPDLNQMQVAAVIPEPEAGKIQTQLPVEIRLDSNPDRVFKGKIKELGRIFRTKSNDQPAIVFDADISILNPDPEAMRPGMSAGVDIIVSSKKDVLQVKEAALIYLEKGIFVLKKSLFGKKKVRVTIGARSGGMVEILSGLKENDRLLVVSGQDSRGGDA
ncbi:MAG: HlyD family efflux transporter periplasmic adaptor subunit [bacterium]|nr:HlyD family efflux transporter periplasmic adaptor subunit [bacterium]